MVFALVAALVCVLLDRATKYLAVAFIGLGESKTVVDGVLNFTYIRNEGMAFGLLSDKRYIFIIASLVLLAAMLVFLFMYRKQANGWLKASCGLIIGGGIGNMIDRLTLGYVIDFIDVRVLSFWKWIFNFADACVCVGVGMLAVYLIIDAVKTERENKRAEKEANEAKEAEENDE